MITTIDGVEKKRGERVWEIARSIQDWKIVPTLTKLTGKERNGEGWPNYWDDYELCKIQCDLMNKDKI